MKNPKKLTRKQKEFLKAKGFDPKCYQITKNLSDSYEFLNIVTKMPLPLYKD